MNWLLASALLNSHGRRSLCSNRLRFSGSNARLRGDATCGLLDPMLSLASRPCFVDGLLGGSRTLVQQICPASCFAGRSLKATGQVAAPRRALRPDL